MTFPQVLTQLVKSKFGEKNNLSLTRSSKLIFFSLKYTLKI